MIAGWRGAAGDTPGLVPIAGGGANVGLPGARGTDAPEPARGRGGGNGGGGGTRGPLGVEPVGRWGPSVPSLSPRLLTVLDESCHVASPLWGHGSWVAAAVRERSKTS